MYLAFYSRLQPLFEGHKSINWALSWEVIPVSLFSPAQASPYLRVSKSGNLPFNFC
jgi:hypothetical protein